MSSAAATPRFNMGQRVTIKGFSKTPGDATIRKVNADGTLKIKYADGATYSSTDPSLATLHIDDDVAPDGRQRDGAQFAPGSSRYDAGYAKRKINLTLAFVGTDFQGMQLQSNKAVSWEEQPPTIEHRLMSEYQQSWLRARIDNPSRQGMLTLIARIHARVCTCRRTWGVGWDCEVKQGVRPKHCLHKNLCEFLVHSRLSSLNIAMFLHFTRDLSKNGWSRSSRTDKGVHAIGCSVACKLVVPLASMEENAGHFSEKMLEEINTHLPESIRLVDGYRVSKVRNLSLLERIFHGTGLSTSRVFAYRS